MRRLITAKTNNEWVTVKTLSIDLKIRLGTVYKTLKRLLDDLNIERKRIQPQKGQWFYVYRASDIGQVRQELGGPPRGSEKVSKQELDVIVRSVTEVLDMKNIDYEDRQVTFVFDPFITGVVRYNCPASKNKKDRAEQVTHAESAYVVTIANSGRSTIVIKDPMKWHIDFSNWLKSIGISKKAIEIILKQIFNQLPGGTTRAEIPILDQSVKRLQVKADMVTTLRDPETNQARAILESNINYSMNKVGIEYFGTTAWVDALIRTLFAFQHDAGIVWASQDQFIEDIWRAIETKRKEEEERQEAEKRKKGGPDYVI